MNRVLVESCGVVTWKMTVRMPLEVLSPMTPTAVGSEFQVCRSDEISAVTLASVAAAARWAVRVR
jgi:hypothetical protein